MGCSAADPGASMGTADLCVNSVEQGRTSLSLSRAQNTVKAMRGPKTGSCSSAPVLPFPRARGQLGPGAAAIVRTLFGTRNGVGMRSSPSNACPSRWLMNASRGYTR